MKFFNFHEWLDSINPELILLQERHLEKNKFRFLMLVTVGISFLLAIANVLYLVHRFLPTTPSIDTAITLISPYFCYLAAENFHFSGVLSVVSAGLFLSWRSDEIFKFDSRIQAYSVWEALIFILNGIVMGILGGIAVAMVYGKRSVTTA